MECISVTKSCLEAKTIRVEVVWGMFGCSGDTYVWHAGSSNSHSRAGHGAGVQYSEEIGRSKIASLEISIFRKSREFKSLRLTSLEAS